MSNTSIGISFLQSEASGADLPPSERLSAEQKKDLATSVLSGSCSVTDLANQYKVSRKYLYSLVGRAEHALDQEFSADSEEDEALFYLPVTKRWITQLVIGLVLICSASYRQVMELFEALLDNSISIGTVHNYMQEATQKAIQINQQEELGAIETTALDEIFQGSTPVLAVADTESTYCALLQTEECRDGDTWGVNLLDLEERGFAPTCSIADYGRGLRAGHRVAREGETCRGDVFHPIRDLNVHLWGVGRVI